MKYLLAVFFAFMATTTAISLFSLADEEWEVFKYKHEKNYTSKTEEEFRMRIFIENKMNVAKHNQLFHQGLSTFQIGLNKYSDQLNTEFISIMNGFRGYNSSDRLGASKYQHLAATFLDESLDDINLPKAVDWRTKGAVSEIKDQGQCGSCWAFSSTGSLEGQNFLKNGKMVELSEQNLVDCSTSYGNAGCNGGLMDNAFKYIKDNHGIDTETSYPYEAMDEDCHFKKSDVGASDKGFMDIREGSEKALKKAVAVHGPISVAIDASHPSFQQYQSGVYNEPECDPEQLDHGVLVVGYGTDEESGQDYWIVKNSWGTSWGEDGYIKMRRNHHNMCGIASKASFPLV